MKEYRIFLLNQRPCVVIRVTIRVDEISRLISSFERVGLGRKEVNCFFGCFYLSDRESESGGKLISVNYAANNFNCFNFVFILNYLN